MNQEQVKSLLQKLDDNCPEYSLVFSGKQSKRVNGLYKPDTGVIIIHNRNFESDNDLIYTAIHEFAHHIHFTSAALPVSNRSHTNAFWDIFHRLLERAEAEGVYHNIFEVNEDFIALTGEIKNDFIKTNGRLMKDLGSILIKAQKLCEKTHTRLDDYVDRVLGIPRISARVLMKISALDIDPAIGIDNMKTVAQVKDPAERKKVEEDFISGKSPESVKASLKRSGLSSAADEESSALDQLVQEKARIERSIFNLQEKLDMIQKRIRNLDKTEA